MKTYVVVGMSAVILSIGWAGTAQAEPTARGVSPCVVAIRTVFARDGASVVNRFVALSFRESRHQAGIVNRRRTRLGHATGCLQILPGVARNVGSRCDLRNAMCNANAARRLWLRLGWSPWRVR